ncbi:hypothetical protein KM043_018621 [Ampulex compressa]|uniref:Venom protein n=1 Tax=Ampulex compressa TaxID=860918 RepID=A0A1W6EVU4_AMPCP|nr:venom protein [Ampulex compressa]KAG7202288.1 hypothetical protein KM043_018621 [Ampulex compressa]
MRTSLALCILGVFCGFTTVRADSTSFSSPYYSQLQSLRTLTVQLSTFSGEIIFDASYKGSQIFASALSEVLSPIFSLRPRIQQLVSEEKDVESCVTQVRTIVDIYKKRLQAETMNCSEAYQNIVDELEARFTKTVQSIRNSSLQMGNIPFQCQLSNDPQKCEAMSASEVLRLLTNAQTLVQTTRAEITTNLNQAYNDVTTCLQGPVDVLKVQLDNVKATITTCLDNL